MAGDPVISIQGLGTRFGRQVVHDGVDLEVRRGEILGLVGGSGSGKSVLMRTVIGLEPIQTGTIEVLGRNLAELDPAEWAELRGRWGVLFQDGALFSGMSVAENVMIPLAEQRRLPRLLRRELAAMKVGLVGLKPEALNLTPAQLSGGMRKRAGLARALALDPEILFLDEPTAGLDPIGAAAFDRLVASLSRALGLTVVMVTHDLDTLCAICDRVAVLVDRKIRVGRLEEVAHDPHPWIRDYFHGPRGRKIGTDS